MHIAPATNWTVSGTLHAEVHTYIRHTRAEPGWRTTYFSEPISLASDGATQLTSSTSAGAYHQAIASADLVARHTGTPQALVQAADGYHLAALPQSTHWLLGQYGEKVRFQDDGSAAKVLAILTGHGVLDGLYSPKPPRPAGA